MAKVRHKSIQKALASGLLSDAEVSAVETGIQAGRQSPDADSVIARLVESGRLTPFQADRVRSGESEALMYGDYVVQDKLGQGGMGVVYRAIHKRMKRIIALKVLPAESMKSPSITSIGIHHVAVAQKEEHETLD